MRSFAKISLLLFVFLVLPSQADANRVWSSGCELQGDVGGNMTNNLEFTVEGTDAASTQISTTVKRSGDSSCRFLRSTDGFGQVLVEFSLTSSSATSAPVYIRTYLYIETTPSEDAGIITVWDRGVDGNIGILDLQTDRTLRWSDNDGTVDGDGSTVLALQTWYRIEVKYDDTGNDIDVLINGVEDFSAGTHDGTGIDSVRFGLCNASTQTCGADGIASGEIFMDDMAVNDSIGTTQNSYPGAGSIVHMIPNAAGDTDNSTTTPNGHLTVDEQTPDDFTTAAYLPSNNNVLQVNVESSSSAGIDSFDTVTLVQVGYRWGAGQAGAGSGSLNSQIKSAAAGTTINGTTLTRTANTFVTNDGGRACACVSIYVLTQYTDPDTALAWTPTGTNSLDNMQLGARAPDALPDMAVSTFWALVEFVDGAAPQTEEQSNSQGYIIGI